MSRSASTSQVAVVGAGLGGTALAAFLGRLGVPVRVLDRRDGPSDLPRARMVSARSMELFRELGVAERITQLGRPGAYQVPVVDTLSDAPTGPPDPDDTATVSPTGAALCDQDLVEGVLREVAADHGARFAWGNEVTALVEAGDGVRLQCAAGEPIAARFAVIAEGGRARLREAGGIAARTASDPSDQDFPGSTR